MASRRSAPCAGGVIVNAPLVLADKAALINSEHAKASKHADRAVEHARRAGELLLEVKSHLPHGEWILWLTANCEVSDRQAQRYMRAARGLPISPQRIKYDAMADLKSIVSGEVADMPNLSSVEAAKLIPTIGQWITTTVDDAAFHVVPSKEYPTMFHVSKLCRSPALGSDQNAETDDDGEPASWYCGTRSPVPPSMVDQRLKHYGLACPSNCEWRAIATTGMSRPFGEPTRLTASIEGEHLALHCPT